jgi:hypothetical protein
MITPSPADLLACAEREVRMRDRVYPRWVQIGRMTQAKADHEIACMKEIADLLRQQVPAEPAQGDLL